MKKFLYTLLIFIILLIPYNVFAASNLYYYDNAWNIHSENITVKLNGEKINFDVLPVIIGDRTMVPARAFFEKAGAKVTWNQASQTVTVAGNQHSIKLTINSKTVLVNGIKKTLDVPAKILTDVSGAGRTLIPIRFISENLGYNVEWDEKTYTVFVTTEEGTPPDDKIDEEKKSEYIITDILNTYDKKGDTVTIKVNKFGKEPKISTLSAPDRLILDFEEFDADFPDGSTGKSGKWLTNVRYAVHEDYFRIVIDLKTQSKYSIKKGANSYEILLDGATYKNIDYTNLGGSKIEIDDLSAISFVSSKNNVYIFTINSQNLGFGTIETDDTYIEKIIVTQENKKTTLSVYATEKMKYQITKNGQSQYITFQRESVASDALSVKLDNKAKDMLVVIDPGHGGEDCGALGKEGEVIDLMEKDVNLDISTYLSEYLTSAGVKNIMTRTDDTFVELLDRTKIANQNNAELFVSIHINSFTSDEPNGTSVYYYKNQPKLEEETEPEENTEETEIKTEEVTPVITGEWFAQTVLDELLDHLKIANRGICDGSKLVVIKHTAMPAVLVETAFISNKNDKELLKTKEFRKAAAKAVAEGIVKALNETVRIREN